MAKGAGISAHELMDTSSSSFYAHHWVKPHKSIYGLTHGYFERQNNFQADQHSTIPHDNDTWWAEGVKGSQASIPHSAWVAGESV
ncbi:hypothetical protein GUITHDRAFT_154062 [Guillardia theta CCMP2712]|uniref:Uncharacterized protein n=1 Tax=Guillardia theta (strain CCMP2712) TaxID=905079 RepID=L1IY10_GUITC|nr:hypothetical protein GUITHDRAFT_154062 [Guillardia theta CCMP2712]EKX40715.1 hypothetical protein GUITHDRAFT_154062 [Guillardia theta CCMP2712]|mmetsp:Transcript_44129/g.139248  ORF Transcript_44129/g.139248 Transcript_44129/m.139248 type:complete len:85 (-) Transcript_44129:237-491(-)|eukprot:XP_005827695.1 hypothetical protein GUITHDRAFT_154062 [Guillardia theta CCMP2712]